MGCNINNLLLDFDFEVKDVMNNIVFFWIMIIIGYFILLWYNYYIYIIKIIVKDSLKCKVLKCRDRCLKSRLEL